MNLSLPPKLAQQQLGSGPEVLLVHGLATNRAFWFLNLAMDLARDHRVTIYDLRGHGYSERPASGYTVGDHADDLLRLMDELGLQSAAVVGHSFGGGVAMEAVLKAPTRFRQLALMDTRVQRLQPSMRLADVQPLTAFQQEISARSGIDWLQETEVGFRFLEAAARQKLAGYEPQSKDEFTPFGEGRGALKAARQWLALIDETSLARDFPVPGAPVSHYGALSLPLLLMYAEHSGAMASAAQLAALLPQARLQRVAGAGHFFPMTHPQPVARAVRELLASP